MSKILKETLLQRSLSYWTISGSKLEEVNTKLNEFLEITIALDRKLITIHYFGKLLDSGLLICS